MEASLIVAVDVTGVNAAAGPITAGAVIYPVNAVEPAFKIPGNPSPVYFLSTPDRIPAGYRVPVRDYVLKSAHCRASTNVEAWRVSSYGVKLASAEAMALAVARVVERHIHHSDDPHAMRDQMRAGLVHVYMRQATKLPEHLVHPMLRQFTSMEDWRVGAAKVYARVAHAQEMERIADIHPAYGFHENHGRMSPGHERALRRNGVTTFHRPNHPAVRRVLQRG